MLEMAAPVDCESAWIVSDLRTLFSGPITLTLGRNTSRRYSLDRRRSGNLKTPNDIRVTFQQPSQFPFSESRDSQPWRWTNTDICVYWGTEDEKGKAVYSLRILSACHGSSVSRGVLLFLVWEFPALRSDSATVCLPFVSSLPASSNPGRNGTAYLYLITMEGDKPTLTY